MDAALQSFTHAAAHRELKWDSSRAGWIKDYVKHIAGSKRRALVEKNFSALYEAEVVPVLPRLRRGVIYGDANDYNVLVSDPWPQPRKVVGVIDFGDVHYGSPCPSRRLPPLTPSLGRKIHWRRRLRSSRDITARFHSMRRSRPFFMH